MQGYLLIEGEFHELAIVPGAGGGYRLPDGRSIALLPALGDAPAGVRVGDRRYDAEIAVAADSIWVHLDGTTYEVTWRSDVDHHAGAATATDSGAVRAQMPGAVVAVLVQPGDRVSAGDAVVVIESMKLETTIRAPRDGVVAAVDASVGQSFERDVILFEIVDGEP